MFVERIPNRNSNPTWLVRESKWVNGKAVKTTLANITKLPMDVILGIRIQLKGGTVVKDVHKLRKTVCDKARVLPHGHVLRRWVPCATSNWIPSSAHACAPSSLP